MQFHDSTNEKKRLSDDSYDIIRQVYRNLSKLDLGTTKFRNLAHRELLAEFCGISVYAAEKAILIENRDHSLEVKRQVGRPRKVLKPDYSSSVQELAHKNNKEGVPNTVSRLMSTLKVNYNIEVCYSTLLRDLKYLGFRYRKGERKNILHDAPSNIMYRQIYVTKRLGNLTKKKIPRCAEVFLDESYCHVDHHAEKSWSQPKEAVYESGRKPLVVIFAAFVVTREMEKLRANMIESSIKTWSVQGKQKCEEDYHGNFDADKFVRLFENLCRDLAPYGQCIIHMDGASYHKRRINPTPTSATPIKDMINWFEQNNLPLPVNVNGRKKPTKKDCLEAIKQMKIKPHFRVYEIADQYGHEIIFTPPYHSELQPIEKVWSMVKNPIAFDPRLDETSRSLEDRLKGSLREIKEKSLISVWKMSVEQCESYSDQVSDTVGDLEEFEEDEGILMTSS